MDNVIIAASTHWDREWYRTFEDFRIRLCDMMNSLLELLEKDEDFVCYTFDGQSIVLDDYLEIFPQNRERIKALAARGKLVFGPLYNLPDEFLSSGEALIRNFLVGHRVCSEIGGKMNAGYMPDNFGHVSQLPQILNGVGIKSVFLFRGCGIEGLGHKEFRWKSPDASEVLGEYLPQGYWNLKSWGRLGFPPEEHFRNAYEALKPHSKLGTFLMINGSDHLYQDPGFSGMLKLVKNGFKDLDIKNGSFEDYFKLALERAKTAELKEVRGELRDFRYGPDPTSTTSTRYYLKLAMFNLLREVERYTEPLSTIAHKMGYAYPGELLTHAWKNILRALAHDAITGCSSDETMEDVYCYIRHARTLADRLSETALERLADNTDTGGLEKNEQYLGLFNPLHFDNTVIAEAVVHVEGREGIPDIELLDEERNPVRYEYLDKWDDVATREFKYESKEKICRKCFRIRFEARDIPALGVKRYIVRPLRFIEKRQSELFVRLQNSQRFIENEFYRITPQDNGALTILDKSDNREYKDLNAFISRGDIGDEYQHVSPLNDEHVFPVLKSISFIGNSPLSSVLKLRSVLSVPRAADDKLLGRHSGYVECPVETLVTVYKNCRRIDFEVEIENHAVNHMVTVKFPTAYKNAADYSYVSFDEVKRDNRIFDYDGELKSTQSVLKPMQKYVCVRGEDGALNVMVQGLYEYHTKPSANGLELYITLLRSTSHMFAGLPVSWLGGQHSTTPIIETQGSRELGKSTFRYSLCFGTEKIGALYEQYAYPPRCFDIRKKSIDAAPKSNVLSFISMDSDDVLLSAVKKHEYSDGTVLRIYNTGNTPACVSIKTGFSLKECYCCNLLEELEERIAVHEDTITISLEPGKIKTLVLY